MFIITLGPCGDADCALKINEKICLVESTEWKIANIFWDTVNQKMKHDAYSVPNQYLLRMVHKNM